ncbi:hypothetical protein D3C85_1521130 [compost metagenome]
MNTNSITQNVSIKSVADTSWTEGGITWNTKPAMGSTLTSVNVPATAVSSWIELDITSHITGNGTFSVGITASGANAIRFHSKEKAGFEPQLIITTQ